MITCIVLTSIILVIDTATISIHQTAPAILISLEPFLKGSKNTYLERESGGLQRERPPQQQGAADPQGIRQGQGLLLMLA